MGSVWEGGLTLNCIWKVHLFLEAGRNVRGYLFFTVPSTPNLAGTSQFHKKYAANSPSEIVLAKGSEDFQKIVEKASVGPLP